MPGHSLDCLEHYLGYYSPLGISWEPEFPQNQLALTLKYAPVAQLLTFTISLLKGSTLVEWV